MKYLIETADGLFQADSLSPRDLVDAFEAGMVIIRCERDSFEYAEVQYREVDHPGNSFDETRQDQAIDGKIYEVSAWRPLQRFSRDGSLESAEGLPTIVDSDRVLKQFRDETESEADRKERVLAEADERETQEQK